MRHVPVDTADVGVECVEALNGAGNEGDEQQHDGEVVQLESEGEGLAPRPLWVGGSHNALREDEVDDEEQQDASRHKDLSGDGDADVGGVRCPDQPHGAGGDSRHAKAEEDTRQDELLAPTPVDLQDSHVSDSA